MIVGKLVFVLSNGYRTAAPVILTLESYVKENTYVKSNAM
jgi:hypothetical protein